MMEPNEYWTKLYREEMARAREQYAKLWSELHPNGQPLMQVEITVEMLRKMSPEARQTLTARYPQDVLRALAGGR